jgi:hypothetical protein
MKRSVMSLLFFALMLSVSVTAGWAQAASEPMHQSAAAGHHGTFTVELTKPLDSKKLKVGDSIEAKLTGGITLPGGAQVPVGTKVIGHVTQVSSRGSGEAQSSLGIAFDKMSRGGGEDTTIAGTMQAVAPNPNYDVSTGNNGVDYGNTLRSAMAPAGATSGDRPHTPQLTDESTGVLGIKNMKLDNGVLTSSNKDLKLDAGTRILLSVTMH